MFHVYYLSNTFPDYSGCNDKKCILFIYGQTWTIPTTHSRGNRRRWPVGRPELSTVSGGKVGIFDGGQCQRRLPVGRPIPSTVPGGEAGSVNGGRMRPSFNVFVLVELSDLSTRISSFLTLANIYLCL